MQIRQVEIDKIWKIVLMIYDDSMAIWKDMEGHGWIWMDMDGYGWIWIWMRMDMDMDEDGYGYGYG